MEDVATHHPTAQARVIAAVCAECEAQVRATHKPDACFACGAIDGPWVLVTQWSDISGASLRLGLRYRLAGVWSAARRAQAVVDLGDMLEGG